MPTFTFDAGRPMPAFAEGAATGLILETGVCPSATCPALHIVAVKVPVGTDVLDTARFGDADALHFTLTDTTGELQPVGEETQAWFGSEESAWLLRWIAEHSAVLHLRFARLKGQLAAKPADAGPAPLWRPGDQIYHAEIFPDDFTPCVKHNGGFWMIADACCPDPACGCGKSTLVLHGPANESIDLHGRLGDPTPEPTTGAGRDLWKAIHRDEELVELLGERRDDVRHAGPFIVGAAYERARLAGRRDPAPAPAGEGGYLRGGAVPVALVERLFAAGALLHAARAELGAAQSFHVEVRAPGRASAPEAPPAAPATLEAWLEICDDVSGFGLFERPGDGVPWLELAMVERGLAPDECVRERCAHGWPLIAGSLLPVVMGREEREPEVPELRLAVAIAEALVAAAHDLDLGEVGGARSFEHVAKLDEGSLEVTLTANHPDAPRNDVEDPDDDEDLEDESRDEDEDGDGADGEYELDDDEDARDRVATALAAFRDAAFDRGVAEDVIGLACQLGEELAEYVDETDGGAVHWFQPEHVEAFLSRHVPRRMRLTAGEIARAPEAMKALAVWLADVGHIAVGSLDQAIERGSRAHRWRPQSGAAVPAATAPCPCGSGRRYKKCCMPR